MDIKKQPKPWYIRYRYPILSGAAGIAILVYALFLIVTSGTRRVDPDSVVIAEVKKAPFWEYVDVEGLVYPFKTIQVNYNPQNEMFSPCKTKCSKSKTKCLRFSTLQNHIKNSVRTAFLPNSNAISISTYQCLSYHNFKALHIGEFQAAILSSLEKLFLVNFLDGYLYLGIGKV